MAALLASSDLTLLSKFSAAGQRTGVKVDTALGIDALWPKAAAMLPALVVVDLSLPQLDVQKVIERLRAMESAPRTIIAFGPHVQKELLAAASTAGCDHVLSRGQFDARMADLLGVFGND